MNNQPVEPSLVPGPDGPYSLDVHSVWQTFQGEGPFAGTPAVFIRLAGCNLRCPLCDTDYTSQRERVSVWELVKNVQSVRSAGTRLVVISGGEPFRQNIVKLVDLLVGSGWTVQIETNGTAINPRFDYSLATVVVSPKVKSLHPGLSSFIENCTHEIRRRFAFKYVIAQGEFDQNDGLPTTILGKQFPPSRPPEGIGKDQIYVQPLDEQDEAKNLLNLEAAKSVCLKFGYRLCVQIHKTIGVA